MEYIKVVIVDDELIIRNGLKNYNWKRIGCKVVGDAKNAEEGLRLVNLTGAQIVLSDIKMPGKDGLQFAKMLKSQNPNIEIILLSGYDQFDYAKEALKIGVRDYLLKPTNFEDLEKVMRNAVEVIRSRQKQMLYLKDIEKRYKLALPMLKEKLTHSLLHSSFSNKETVMNKLNLYGIKLEKFIVVVGKINLTDISREALTEFCIMNICTEIFENGSMNLLKESNEEEFSFIIDYDRCASDEVCISTCIEGCKQAQQIIKEYINIDIAFGISNVSIQLLEIQQLYKEAHRACIENVFLDSQEIFCYKDIPQRMHGTYDIQISENVVQAFNKRDMGLLEEELSNFREYTQTERLQMHTIRFIVVQLIITCLESLSKNPFYNDSIEINEEIQEKVNHIYTQDNLRVIINILQECLLKLLNNSQDNVQEYHQRLIEKVMSYIEENFQEDLSLDLLAEKVNLSTAYISRLIKKVTHKSFMEILLEVRMKAAKELLKDNKLKIAEIGNQVGYKDTSYFIQVFKKYYGLTPKEFKNII